MAILEILRLKIDIVLKEFKLLKQKILKKLNKRETFYRIKEDYLKSLSNEKKGKYYLKQHKQILDNPQSEVVKSFIKNVVITGSKSFEALGATVTSTPPLTYKGIQSPLAKSTPSLNPNLTRNHHEENSFLPEPPQEEQSIYTDNPSIINLFKTPESKDLEKTKQILFELSDLVNTFSHKVVEQHQLTENSKNY